VRSLQNYKTYTNLSVLLNLVTLRTRKILSLDIILSWIPRSPFWITEIEGSLLTYDQMSDNDLLSCTNSLVTIMAVINHRNIPRGPRCLQHALLFSFIFGPFCNNFNAYMYSCAAFASYASVLFLRPMRLCNLWGQCSYIIWLSFASSPCYCVLEIEVL